MVSEKKVNIGKELHKTGDRAIASLPRCTVENALFHVSSIGKVVARLRGVSRGKELRVHFFLLIDDNGPCVFTPLCDYAKGSRTE